MRTRRLVRKFSSEQPPLPRITNDFSSLSFTVGTSTDIQLLISTPESATFALEYSPSGVTVSNSGLLTIAPSTSGPYRVGIRVTLLSGFSFVNEIYFIVQPQDGTLPDAPSGLSLVWDESNNRFGLTWTAQGAEVVSYVLGYELNGAPSPALVGFGITQPILLPNNAPPLNTQFADDDQLTVYLRAVNAQGLQSLPATATATVQISQLQLPPELSATSGDQQIDVVWSNPVGTPPGAMVQINSRRESLPPTSYEVPSNALAFSIPGVVPGSAYYVSARYRIPGSPDTFSAYTSEIPVIGQASEITVERSFNPSTAFSPKPNDGVVYPVGFKSLLTSAELTAIKSQGFRTVLWLIDISSARLQATFPTQLKTDIADSFAWLRTLGMKAIIRPVYTMGNQVTSWQPSAANALAHVDEMADIVNTNKSLISLVQCGFVGVAGLEGSFGTYAEDTFGIETPSVRTQIYDKILSVYPTEVFILSRRFRHTSSLDDIPIDPGPGAIAEKVFPFVNSERLLVPGSGLLTSNGFVPSTSFGGIRTYKHPMSCARWAINMDGFGTTAGPNLPDSFINGLHSTFQSAAANGIMIVLHICYSRDYHPHPNNSAACVEPSMGIVLSHLQRLSPIINQYNYVIAATCLGIGGAWGENHKFYATGANFSGLCTHANLTIIRDYLFQYFPGDKHIMVRYPRNLLENPDTDENVGWVTSACTEGQAYGGTDLRVVSGVPSVHGWRLGKHVDSSHNNGWMSGLIDYEAGFKWPQDPARFPLSSARIMFQENFFRADEWTPMYCEGGTQDQFAGGPVTSGFTRRNSIDYLKIRNASFFNFTKSNSFSKMESWMGGDSAEEREWRFTLGARFHLRRLRVEVNSARVKAEMDWSGIGSSRHHIPHGAYLEFTPTSGGAPVIVQLTQDIRKQLPGGSKPSGPRLKSQTYDVARPGSLTSGVKNIRLWMPIEYSQNKNDGRYAIPINSQGITFSESTGRNDPGMVISVP
jgi:hypothetical protein